MEVASLQMGVAEDDKAKAIDRAVETIRSCHGADLIVLPELWNIGFMSFDHYYSQSETEDGPTLSAMRSMAREMKAYLHTGSLVLQEDDKYYNASYLLSPREKSWVRIARSIFMPMVPGKNSFLPWDGRSGSFPLPWEFSAWPRALTCVFPSSSDAWWTTGRKYSWSVRPGPIPGWSTG